MTSMNDGGKPTSRWSHRAIRLSMVAIAFLLAAVMGGLTTVIVVLDRNSDQNKSGQSVLVLSRTLELFVDRALADADAGLREVSHDMRNETSAAQLEESLRLLSVNHPMIRSAMILSLTGNIVASTNADNQALPPGIEPEYLRVHIGDRRKGTFVGTPIRMPGSDRWMINLSRRVEDNSGQLTGVLVAQIDSGFFDRFFKSFDPSRFTITVVRRDGIVLATSPFVEATMGSNQQRNAVFRALSNNQSGGAGIVGGKSPIDGSETTIGYAALSEWPVIVYVSAPTFDPQGMLLRTAIVVVAIVSFLSILFLLVRVRREILDRLTSERKLRRREAELSQSLTRATTAEKALSQSERDLRSILDHMPALISYWDRNLINRFSNEAFADWLNIAPDQLRGRSLADVLAEPQFQRAKSVLEAAVGGEYQYFERKIDPYGSSQVGYLQVQCVPDRRGDNIVGVYVLAVDITQLRQAQAELEDQRDELRRQAQIIEQSPNMIILTDIGGQIIYTNLAFSTISGYSKAEVLGRNPRLLKSGETSAETYADMWRTLLAGRTWDGELKDRCKDGSSFWARVTISPIRSSDGTVTHYCAVHRDITAEKQMTDSLREAKESAEIANRAKTEMLANMSHELRTPLNAIIGFSHLIMTPSPTCQNDKHREYAALVNASGTHLAELVSDILDASTIEAGRLELSEESIDLDSVIGACIRMVQHRAELGEITIDVVAGEQRVGLLGDTRRVKQIVLNLLSNAVKFSNPGGRVTCGIRRTENGGVEISIADNGVGMDARGIAVALTPFGQVDNRLSRQHEGTGLGLPLTRGLVEAHGGQLLIDSTEGVGTTVRVLFPPARTILKLGAPALN